MKLSGLLLVLVAAIAVVVAGGALWLRAWLDAPLAVGETPIRVEVPRGQPLGATAQRLAGAGVLDHPRVFTAYARWRGVDARVRAGEYELAPGTTPRALLRQFESGAVVQRSVTFVEGRSFRELRAVLDAAPALTHTLAGRPDSEVMRALGEPELHPEGLFFPDTYLYDRDTEDLGILRQARERMRRELAAAWAGRAPDLPLETPYEALILASIVEKETALAAERPRIAGVFLERLRRGMLLQTDPTVIYGLGAAFDGNLRRADLERDGPYNTYRRPGLPPTPIAAPGRAALQAAVRPELRGELYFVATGLPDGSHRFSRSLAEHEAAVRDYLRELRKRREAR